LLLGTTSYGFDLEIVDEILDLALKYDEAQLSQCRDYASGFAEIQEKASKFVEDLNVFAAAQQLYSASILTAVAEIRAEVQDPEFVKTMKRVSRSKKADTFKEKVTGGLDKLKQGEEKATFEEKAALVEAAVNDLATTVRRSLEDVTKFFAECNDLHLATTEDKEYLLDICDQGGGDEVDCIEKDGSSHLSCVCTFNPLIFLGLESKSSTTEIMLGANDGRRLSMSDAQKEAYDALKGAYEKAKPVCAEAWTKAAPVVTGIYDEIKALGQDEQILDYYADMKAAYADIYCGFPGAPTLDEAKAYLANAISPEDSFTAPRNLLLIVLGMMFIHPGLHPY